MHTFKIAFDFIFKKTICLLFKGYQYGMMSLKAMLSTMLRHYRFTTNLKMSELEMEFHISLKLCNKHMVGVERRVW